MQKSGCDRLLIHFKVRQYNGHAQGMDNIRLPGLAHLIFMGFGSQMIGFFYQGRIIRRVILLDTQN